MFWLKKKTETEQVTSEPPKPTDRWTVSESFEFSYGHRVWGHPRHRARQLHGHSAILSVSIHGDPELEWGLSTDPDELNWLDDLIKNHIDHKFIVHLDDPWLPNIVNGTPQFNETGLIHARRDDLQEEPAGSLSHLKTHMPLNTHDDNIIDARPIFAAYSNHLIGHTLNTSNLDGPEQEFFDSFLFVDFVPTSENIIKWFYEIIAASGTCVADVSLHIPPKYTTTYSGS